MPPLKPSPSVILRVSLQRPSFASDVMELVCDEGCDGVGLQRDGRMEVVETLSKANNLASAMWVIPQKI